ncbi:FAD-dependent monooxygenase [Arthrobacter koreensis]|uniref:FAD-dependent monooxygenase n=1 Tax=Arthrobacter koreensis TaxID=199136 RepID=UPI002DBB7929|nr:FAD-dependent monooxygenase [Arthrobacter koreensis]MEB7447667.1 FAD-dependent monooxygenase [Arthrobacter koreensis]
MTGTFSPDSQAGTHVQVLVAGMGPTGMVAALALAQRGIPVTVLEAGTDLAEESRASTFHPPSLEMLDDLGILAEVEALGLPAPRFQYRDKSGAILADLLLEALSDDTRFPYRLQCEQNRLTEVILAKLADYPHATLRFSAPVQRVELGTGNARVFLEGDGRQPSYTADWLIAADGARSKIRKSLGIAFEGLTLPERFLVASTTHELAQEFDDLALVAYLSDPADWGVLLRTPRHWRVLMPIGEGTSDAEALDPATIERRIQNVAPKDGSYPLDHANIYVVQQRVASTMAAGRVLLAGDSAHVNNPLGGMGMNSGIHDAVAAARTVAAALAGADAELAAKAYDDARRSTAVNFLQKNTIQNYKDLQETDTAARHERTVKLGRIAADRELSRSYLLNSSMLSAVDRSNDLLEGGLRAARSAAAPAGRRLWAALSAGTVVAPGAYDAVSAALVRNAGFGACFVSGAAAAAVSLGCQDQGYVGRTDMLVQLGPVAAASGLPVIADGDGGYGDARQAAHTTAAYERAGAAAITIEDQFQPKAPSGVPVVLPAEQAAAKIEAAVAARRELLVIARTDAYAAEGFPGVLQRARAYAAAGADLIFPEGPLSLAELTALHRATGKRLVLNRSEARNPAPVALEELSAAGVALVLYPVTGLLAAGSALSGAYESLAAQAWPVATEQLGWTSLNALLASGAAAGALSSQTT